MSASAFSGVASSDGADGAFGGDDLLGVPHEGVDVPSCGLVNETEGTPETSVMTALTTLCLPVKEA